MEYTDIGHRDPDSLLWIWNHAGALEVRSISDGTHASLWGLKSIAMWKGRFEPRTRRLSVRVPIVYEGIGVPQPLCASLKSRFGTDAAIHTFSC